MAMTPAVPGESLAAGPGAERPLLEPDAAQQPVPTEGYPDPDVAVPDVIPSRQPANVSELPGRHDRDPAALEPGEKKREALIRLYEERGQDGDPRYGDRTKAAELAREIALEIDYHAGTAPRTRPLPGRPARSGTGRRARSRGGGK